MRASTSGLRMWTTERSGCASRALADRVLVQFLLPVEAAQLARVVKVDHALLVRNVQGVVHPPERRLAGRAQVCQVSLTNSTRT
jgi:hypothetical protein